jgi:hypothetical protein
MPNLTLTKRIHAPQQVVFDLATDLQRAAEHIDGIEKIEMLTPGPVGVGTRWRETRRMFGKEATEEMEVTRFDPPNSYSAGTESCGCAYEFTFRFLPLGNSTNVEMEMQYRPISFFARLMSPLGKLMLGPMKKLIDQDLEDLKRTAEARAPAQS